MTHVPSPQGHGQSVLLEDVQPHLGGERTGSAEHPPDDGSLEAITNPAPGVLRQQRALARETQIGLGFAASSHATASHGRARPDW
jgi:hypothetical protein